MKSDKIIQSHDRLFIQSPEKVNFDRMKFDLLIIPQTLCTQKRSFWSPTVGNG